MLIQAGNYRLVLILQAEVILHTLVVSRGIHKVGDHGDLPRLDRLVEQRHTVLALQQLRILLHGATQGQRLLIILPQRVLHHTGRTL